MDIQSKVLDRIRCCEYKARLGDSSGDLTVLGGESDSKLSIHINFVYDFPFFFFFFFFFF
jgi:hypothetical protein